MKINIILVFGFLFLVLMDSCTKRPDITPRYTISGEGYFKDYYFTDSVVPNIRLRVDEEVSPDREYDKNYQIIKRGYITSDSKGHFNFTFKVFSLASQFDITEEISQNFRPTTERFPDGLKDTGTNHFNFYVAPSSITEIFVYDPGTYPTPWDSIHLINPYDTNIIFRWWEGQSNPPDPTTHYGREQLFSVLPGMPYKIVWTWYKNGAAYKGKEIDYVQNPNGTNTILTLTF